MKRKTNQELDCSNFEDLLKFKAISRENFEELISAVSESFNKNLWPEVSIDLSNEGMPLSERMKLKSHWENYSVERINPQKIVLTKLRGKINKILNDLKHEQINHPREIIEKALREYESNKGEGEQLYDQNYIKAMILFEYYNG